MGRQGGGEGASRLRCLARPAGASAGTAKSIKQSGCCQPAGMQSNSSAHFPASLAHLEHEVNLCPLQLPPQQGAGGLQLRLGLGPGGLEEKPRRQLNHARHVRPREQLLQRQSTSTQGRSKGGRNGIGSRMSTNTTTTTSSSSGDYAVAAVEAATNQFCAHCPSQPPSHPPPPAPTHPPDDTPAISPPSQMPPPPPPASQPT